MSRARYRRSSVSLTVFLLLMGLFGCSALWLILAGWTGTPSAWMAAVTAADAALLLRMAKLRSGVWRASLGLLMTAATTVIAYWGMAANQIGRQFGFTPLDTACRLGAEFVWTLSQMNNTPVDWAWLGSGLFIAAVASR